MSRKIYRLLDLIPATMMGRHKELLGKGSDDFSLSLFFPNVFPLISFTFPPKVWADGHATGATKYGALCS